MNKLSYNVIANKSNIQFTRIFHIYRNGKNCKSKISFYLKGSVKISFGWVKTENIVKLKNISIPNPLKIYLLEVQSFYGFGRNIVYIWPGNSG